MHEELTAGRDIYLESFLPMLSRGWQVTACDLSPAMLALAEAKTREAAELMVADMRDLPTFGEFDLIWALDDAINYLLSLEELEEALRGMRRNLAGGGLLLFDVNDLSKASKAERSANLCLIGGEDLATL